MQLDKLDKLDMCALFSRAGSKPEARRMSDTSDADSTHSMNVSCSWSSQQTDAVDDRADVVWLKHIFLEILLEI